MRKLPASTESSRLRSYAYLGGCCTCIRRMGSTAARGSRQTFPLSASSSLLPTCSRIICRPTIPPRCAHAGLRVRRRSSHRSGCHSTRHRTVVAVVRRASRGRARSAQSRMNSVQGITAAAVDESSVMHAAEGGNACHNSGSWTRYVCAMHASTRSRVPDAQRGTGL